MVERRVASVVRALLVTLFLLESVGILLVSLVVSVLTDGSLLDGPPLPARSRVFLTLATLGCFVAIAGAAVEASGLFDRMRVATLVDEVLRAPTA